MVGIMQTDVMQTRMATGNFLMPVVVSLVARARLQDSLIFV